MSVALALYKGKGELANSLIRWKSKSIYSHCELVVDGWMYSSTVRDGGVRCKLAYLPEDHWDIIQINWTNGEEILSYYSETKDNPYGWRDLIQSQIFNRPTADDRGDFCSEWCAKALGIPDAQHYDPARLGELVTWANSHLTK